MTAIIVLNYNDWKTTTQFMDKIALYKSVDKIVIVDNCSTDDSWERLLPLANEKIDVIQSQKNNGYAAGNNVGIRHVRTHYSNVDKVIISNPDITIADSGIQNILNQLDSGYAMATGLIHNYNLQTQEKTLASNFCWRVPKYNDLLWNYPLLTYKIRRSVFQKSIYSNISKYQDEQIIDTECVPGCFFAIRMDALEEIGDFDEDTFLFSEESILGFSLKEKGKKVCVLKDVEIRHEQSTSINKSIKSKKAKEKIRLTSECIYLRNYLKKGKFSVFIYKAFFWFAFYERRLVFSIFKR